MTCSKLSYHIISVIGGDPKSIPLFDGLKVIIGIYIPNL